LALTVGARAQQSNNNVEAVTVTGSRVISDITLSPTPLTVVTAEQLSATTPTNIPDALNKLPDFIGGASPRSQNNGQNNNSGNTLNLRNLGVARTLVLFDGQRVAPSNRDGTVDVDALPQMLMSRVDVVTGGASAMYGSDAVAGVVNLILDTSDNGPELLFLEEGRHLRLPYTPISTVKNGDGGEGRIGDRSRHCSKRNKCQH
jgi:outer membrane cobalamin receptor